MIYKLPKLVDSKFTFVPEKHVWLRLIVIDSWFNQYTYVNLWNLVLINKGGRRIRASFYANPTWYTTIGTKRHKLVDIAFTDKVTISRDGQPIYDVDNMREAIIDPVKEVHHEQTTTH